MHNKIIETAGKIYTNNSSFESKLATLNNNITGQFTELYDKLRPIGRPIIDLAGIILDDEVYLEGAEVSKIIYVKLYEIYGDKYGTPKNSNNLVLPDFRGRAIWGASDFGYIEAGLPNHSHGILVRGGHISESFNAGHPQLIGGQQYWGNWSNVATIGNANNSIYGKNNTVQPPAIKVRVLTRYK